MITKLIKAINKIIRTVFTLILYQGENCSEIERELIIVFEIKAI